MTKTSKKLVGQYSNGKAASHRANNNMSKQLKFIDLFCGIGGFRIAADKLGWACVFSCDIDPDAQKTYQANFGDLPFGDIRKLDSDEVPDHDVLFAGFPCQPFSIIGDRKGFSDTRGTLFFEIARILEAKRPMAFVLENVKQLVGHNGGRTLKRILETLKELGYSTDFKVFNALDFGLPQKRERVFIVGIREQITFQWPIGGIKMTSLANVLESGVDRKYYASKRIQIERRTRHRSNHRPAIWHENKSGHVSSYPFSCALRAGASYNYLLVNGERRLTPREMFRLQGFPDSFKIVCNDSQARKQAGNAVPVPVVKAVLVELQRLWPSIVSRESNPTTLTETTELLQLVS
jgi:DNA (cytosine-5)-methyltransferase 1